MFSFIELWEFFIDSGYKFFIRYAICKYSEFMPCHSLNGTFQESRVFDCKLNWSFLWVRHFLVSHVWTLCLINGLGHTDFPPIVSSRSLWSFTLGYKTHFQLIFVCTVSYSLELIGWHMDVQLFQLLLLKRLFFFLWFLWSNYLS